MFDRVCFRCCGLVVTGFWLFMFGVVFWLFGLYYSTEWFSSCFQGLFLTALV